MRGGNMRKEGRGNCGRGVKHINKFNFKKKKVK